MWCSYCGQKYRLRPELAGKVGTCDECHNEFLIPHESQTKLEKKKAIAFSCAHCEQKLLKPLELRGEEISCHKCGGKNFVPGPPEDEDSPVNILEPFIVAETTRTDLTAVKSPDETPKDDKILFWCNHCGQKYRLPKKLYGKTGVCSNCKNYIFIPHVSQSKPQLKETVSFPCENCGKIQLKAKELAGTEVSCYECGHNNIVPAKSIKPKDTEDQASLLDSFLAVETTRSDLIIPEDKILFWCSHCGQKYRLPRNLYGKAGICTKCQNYIFIPRVSQTTPPKEKSIVFPCKYCGKKQVKSRKLIGEELNCDKCHRRIIVPAKSQISSLAKAGSKLEDRITFWCGYCGQKYRLPEHLAGKSGTCDKCQKRFVIPDESQDKPNMKRTVVFPCEHCGKRLWEEKELAGTVTECVRCGEENVVPERSSISLLDKLESSHFFKIGSQPASMVGDPIVGASTKRKAKPAVDSPEALAGEAEPAKRTQIIITENPPKIHKLKNYFHQKAEKYFVMAIFVILVDYLVDLYESERHPSRAFVTFCAFSIAAIILLGTWNFVTAAPKTNDPQCRYNIICRNGHRETRRFDDINKQHCSRCNSPLGFTYQCNDCKKYFPYRPSPDKSSKENADKGPAAVECPFCHSTHTRYVPPRKDLNETGD
jgi:RNase P subunit RPR2